MSRLFVAIIIPDDVTINLLNVCRKLADTPLEFKWEQSEKVHVTLKFIGEVEEEFVAQIAQDLNFIKNYNSFIFSVARFGFFFRNGEPRILWAGLKTNESIHKLVEELNIRLSIFSVPVEKRKFEPHLTLLRIKKNPGNEFINKFKKHSFENMTFISNQIKLIKSKLSHTGARYSDIKKYDLK